MFNSCSLKIDEISGQTIAYIDFDYVIEISLMGVVGGKLT